MKLKDKVAVITGAGKGIAKAGGDEGARPLRIEFGIPV